MRLTDAEVDVESLIAKHEDLGYERGFRDGYAEALEETDNGPDRKVGKWIPVKFRPMDSEEREYWEEQIGEELAEADAVMFDCPMPEDGQEILVSYRKWISMDKCEIDGGCYGLEGNGDWDGVIAWMPIPMPYKMEEVEE